MIGVSPEQAREFATFRNPELLQTLSYYFRDAECRSLRGVQSEKSLRVKDHIDRIRWRPWNALNVCIRPSEIRCAL